MNAKDTLCVHKAPEEQNQHLIKRTKKKKINLHFHQAVSLIILNTLPCLSLKEIRIKTGIQSEAQQLYLGQRVHTRALQGMAASAC